jgi:hypothetical protein
VVASHHEGRWSGHPHIPCLQHNCCLVVAARLADALQVALEALRCLADIMKQPDVTAQFRRTEAHSALGGKGRRRSEVLAQRVSVTISHRMRQIHWSLASPESPFRGRF